MSLSVVKLVAAKAPNILEDSPHCPVHVLLTPISKYTDKTANSQGGSFVELE